MNLACSNLWISGSADPDPEPELGATGHNDALDLFEGGGVGEEEEEDDDDSDTDTEEDPTRGRSTESKPTSRVQATPTNASLPINDAMEGIEGPIAQQKAQGLNVSTSRPPVELMH